MSSTAPKTATKAATKAEPNRGKGAAGQDRPAASYEGDEFFGSIEESGALPVGVDASEATAAVLCTLLGGLELSQARRVLDSLPPAVTERAGTCPIHGGEQGQALDRERFLAEVAHHFQLASEAVVPVVSAVLQALRTRLPAAAVANIESQLPSQLLALWRG